MGAHAERAEPEQRAGSSPAGSASSASASTTRCIDENTITDHILNTVKGKLTPDYDMFLWGWVGENDPNFILSVFLTSQIGSWSDSRLVRPSVRQAVRPAADDAGRGQAAPARRTRCSRCSTNSRPTSCSCTPRTSSRTTPARGPAGCVRPPGRGGVFYTTAVDSYLYVHPKTAADAGGGGGGGSTTTQWVIVGVVAVIGAGFVVWIGRRRGRRRAESGRVRSARAAPG